MNPFKVKKIIQKHDKICLDSLCQECDTRFRHRYFKMSDDLFFCETCGTNRHYVKGISLSGWIHIPFCKTDYYTF